MGQDKVRHVRLIKGRYFFVPSTTLQKLGFSCEALGADVGKAFSRATFLNSQADKDRVRGQMTVAQELPATAVSRLADEYDANLTARLEKKTIKPRTVKDYRKLMPMVVKSFGPLRVETLTAKVITTWLENEPNQWTRYHAGLMIRSFLKWCVGNESLAAVPEFEVSTPKARKVMWTEPEILEMGRRLLAAGWRSLAVGFLVEWCIGQNPADVWSLPREAYAKGCIDVTRSKTSVGGDPIPLWSDIRGELDAYLADSPALPGAPLFRHEGTGCEWVESTRLKAFAAARETEPAMRKELQMRDLRRTAITEALKLGFKVSEVRSLSRHDTDAGLAPYNAIHAAGKVVEVQRRRGAARSFNKRRD